VPRRRPGRPACLALLGLALASAALDCQARKEPSSPILLIGLDGASWTFLDPLIEKGALPRLARFSREGVRASLETLRPAVSPAVWTTIATGHLPARHGITAFSSINSKDGFVSSDDRQCEALWTILSKRGRTVGFVGWWVTWPAEHVSGYMVSERFLRPGHEKVENTTYPSRLAKELDAAIPEAWPWLDQALEDGRLKLLSDLEPGPEPLTPPRLRLAWFLYGQDHRGEEAALRLLRSRARPELFGFLSRKIDLASHYMARFASKELSDLEMARVLEPVYRYEDELLGRLLEAAGENESVVIVSDHGFERIGAGYDHKTTSPPGIFVAWGPLFRQGVVLKSASVLDVAPTLLHALGLPVANDMRGAVLTAALRERRPIEHVASYETGRRRAGGRTSAQDAEIREELRALGYVE
jgi:predicted AlkP superfamily pyrophosphatase or phosphodiesterase